MAKSAPLKLLGPREVDLLELFFRQEVGWSATAQRLSDAAGKKYHENKPPTRALSPTWAGVLCRRLVAMRLLVKRSAKAKSNGVPTSFYSLPSGFDGFRGIALYYLRSIQQLNTWWVSRATYGFLASQYARAFITPAMVRHELARRAIRMNVAAVAPESLWRPHERTGHFRGRRFRLDLPIATEGTPRETLVAQAVEELAREEKDLEPAAREFLLAFVAQHYASTEDEKLIIPMTALCQVSPNALLALLMKWEPYDLERAQTPEIGMIEHVIFRMVFDAVQDLSVLRNTPDGADVTFATVGPEDGGCVEDSSTLLELDWKFDHRIGFAAGFDTDHMLVFGEDVEAGGVEVERNPENAWVKIAWVKRPKPAWMTAGTTAGE